MKKIAVFMLMFCFFGANAAVWRLNNNPAVDAGFRTFAEAQEAAAAGDTIYIEGNGEQNHYGSVTVTKQLVLIGPGYFLNENDSTYANGTFARFRSMVVQSTAAGTRIYGLYFYSEDYNIRHLTIRASDVVAARNYFYSHDYNQIVVDSSVNNLTIVQNYAYFISIKAQASNCMIANNYINNRIELNNLSNAMVVNNVIGYGINNAYNCQIRNNIIVNNPGGDILSVNNSGNTISYNMFPGGLIAGGIYGPGNVGNINMADVFVGYPGTGDYSTDGRWKLKNDSPAIGAGEGGIDCGIFGGTLPYVLSGLPPVPRIYEAVVPTAGSTASGLPVIIKAISQN
jgi:hypothetical protein